MIIYSHENTLPVPVKRGILQRVPDSNPICRQQKNLMGLPARLLRVSCWSCKYLHSGSFETLAIVAYIIAHNHHSLKVLSFLSPLPVKRPFLRVYRDHLVLGYNEVAEPAESTEPTEPTKKSSFNGGAHGMVMFMKWWYL
ncbi:hypothetical protein [Anoxynatronum buryatiense]|uniref:hypothetical protein n=1 Tax=Anoxynatronum buryatiense TaxID=489973 RepID=UPI0024B7946D|nr:hypothetical protein [Anoxynatronum buryatiense]